MGRSYASEQRNLIINLNFMTLEERTYQRIQDSIGTILKAAYDVEQTHDGVVKIAAEQMAYLARLIESELETQRERLRKEIEAEKRNRVNNVAGNPAEWDISVQNYN